MKIKHNIYINIDGFARYYFDEFVKRSKEEPFLKRIIKEGGIFLIILEMHYLQLQIHVKT